MSDPGFFYFRIWPAVSALIVAYVLGVYFYDLAAEKRGKAWRDTGSDWLPGGFLVAMFWPPILFFVLVCLIFGGGGWLLREGGTYAMMGVLSGVEWAREFGWKKWALSVAPKQNWKDKKDWTLDDVYAGREHLKK